jgi:Plastocyanin
MTRRYKMLTFQAAALAASALLMGTVASMTKAASTATAAASTMATVRIDNFTFKDPIVTVKPGTTVTWTNGDDIPHTVVAKDGSFKSRVLDSGDRFSFTFAKPGQFGYYCSIHPHMTGMVVVKA